MKKLLISITTVALICIILVGNVFTTNAYIPAVQEAFDNQGYGTYEDGVIPPFNFYTFYHPAIQGDGHPNLNFEQGFKYWLRSTDRISNFAKLNKENGNTYMTIISENKYAGIATVKFTNSKFKTGDTIGLLYKWRNAEHQHAIQITMDELYEVSLEDSGWKTIRVSGDGSRGFPNIWTADEDDDKEWNIQLALALNPIKEPIGAKPIVYFSIGVESTNTPEISNGTDVDDIQIIRYNDQSKTVTDLDGKILYNLNNLPKRKVDDYIFGELGETDPKADIKVNVKDLLAGGKKLDNIVNDVANNDNDKDTSLSLWIWVIIAVAVLLLIAASVFIFIVIKKKKSTADTEVIPEVPEAKTEEDTEE